MIRQRGRARIVARLPVSSETVRTGERKTLSLNTANGHAFKELMIALSVSGKQMFVAHNLFRARRRISSAIPASLTVVPLLRSVPIKAALDQGRAALVSDCRHSSEWDVFGALRQRSGTGTRRVPKRSFRVLLHLRNRFRSDRSAPLRSAQRCGGNQNVGSGGLGSGACNHSLNHSTSEQDMRIV